MSEHSEKLKRKLIKELVVLDRVAWNTPSDRTALEVHRLEADFEKLFGEKPPAWPGRDWETI